jgi:hypothetical protein
LLGNGACYDWGRTVSLQCLGNWRRLGSTSDAGFEISGLENQIDLRPSSSQSHDSALPGAPARSTYRHRLNALYHFPDVRPNKCVERLDMWKHSFSVFLMNVVALHEPTLQAVAGDHDERGLGCKLRALQLIVQPHIFLRELAHLVIGIQLI